MTVTPIAVADPPLRSSYGLHQPYALRTVIELRTEDGITGIAEAHGGEKALADFERVRPLIEGRSAYDLALLQAAVFETFLPATASGNGRFDRSQTHFVPGENPYDVALRIYSALEVAALDAIGKATGRPLYDLLGGKVRDRIPFSGYLFFKHAGGGGEASDSRDDVYGECLSPARVVDQARTLASRYGFCDFKLKAGVFDPRIEIEAIEALRAAFPSAPLRIDPNCAWSIETAMNVARRLHGTLDYLEDPVAGIEGMGEMYRRMHAEGCSIPLASNVAVTSFADMPATIEQHASQIILGDHHYWGGPRAIVELGRMCETFDIGLSMHSNSHLGVSLLAMVHVAAATRHMTYPCDTHYPWQSEADEIIEGGRVPIVDGCVRVPNAPGLGVTLDRDQVARGHERYAKSPYRKRDDVAEMRKYVDPHWSRLVPAW